MRSSAVPLILLLGCGARSGVLDSQSASVTDDGRSSSSPEADPAAEHGRGAGDGGAPPGDDDLGGAPLSDECRQQTQSCRSEANRPLECDPGGCRADCFTACGHSCAGGDCVFFCQSPTPCHFDCDGGACEAECRGGGVCELDCAGGGCGLDCTGQSDVACALDCCGGGCLLACGPDRQCDVACAAGGCDVECDRCSTCAVSCCGGGCGVSCRDCRVLCDGSECDVRCASGQTPESCADGSLACGGC